MCIGIHVKYPLFLPDFYENWIFSTIFRKILKISNFMKIRPVGAELLPTDRHDKANSRFSQFCDRAKKTSSITIRTEQTCMPHSNGCVLRSVTRLHPKQTSLLTKIDKNNDQFHIKILLCERFLKQFFLIYFCRCTVHSDICTVHLPTNALLLT